MILITGRDERKLMDLANAAFKFAQALDERLANIEVLLGRLVEAKEDRDRAKELTDELDNKAALLKAAIPAGTSQP